MTLRDEINKRETWSGVLLLISMVASAIAAAIESGLHGRVSFLPCIPMAVGAGCMLYKWFGIRCGRCSGRIGEAVGTSWFTIPANFRFCPYCQIDLDTEVEEARKT
jgi:hypothetical protein